jgi:methyl-accepting chemotaxis protein
MLLLKGVDMRLTKTLKWVGIGLFILIIGGVLYETSSFIHNWYTNSAFKLISDLRRDNQRLRDGLDDANKRIQDIKATENLYRQANSVLENRLNQSKELTDSLKEENKRLGDAINGSLESAGSITESNRQIGEAISRIGDILKKYPVSTGQ